jgi:hypothetical protein
MTKERAIELAIMALFLINCWMAAICIVGFFMLVAVVDP